VHPHELQRCRSLLTVLAILASPALLGAGGGVPDTSVQAAAPSSASAWMDEAYRQKAAGDAMSAAAAFESARAAGADAQRIEVELGYLAAQRSDADAARNHFQRALQGPDPEVGARARAELRESFLQEVSLRKSRQDLDGARAALQSARGVGSDPQRIDLELAYLALAGNGMNDAREHLARASAGPDPAVASRAREQLSLLPSQVWRDFYADVFSWDRVSGGNPSSNAVPTIRLRAGYRLSFETDVSVYLYGQGTRDLASRGVGAGAAPQILADNYASVGAGVLLRLWDRRVGLFLQGGPALNLLDDRRSRLAFDARGGGYLGLETPRCWPSAGGGVSFGLVPCAELYSEITYVSRFADNVIGLLRGRAAATWLITGPVAWQVAGELRAAADRNGDFYNNLVDAGVGPRLRLLRPLLVDIFPSFNAGSYLGRANSDPAPKPLSYRDFRIQVATYLEF